MKTIKEREILNARMRANGYKKVKDRTLLEIPEDGFKITASQTKKGLNWLLNKWKTPRGIERKNNPFGYREENILENFSHFLLIDWNDRASYYQVKMSYHQYLPVYRVVAKDGSYFDYIGQAGIVEIVG